MKKQFKITAFLVASSLVVVTLVACFVFSNSSTKNESVFRANENSESFDQVNEMIETVKVPAYYTVFNVILNYLPLKK